METHRTELLERNLSVFILVRKTDCFVNDLLQLSIFEVVSNHHF